MFATIITLPTHLLSFGIVRVFMMAVVIAEYAPRRAAAAAQPVFQQSAAHHDLTTCWVVLAHANSRVHNIICLFARVCVCVYVCAHVSIYTCVQGTRDNWNSRMSLEISFNYICCVRLKTVVAWYVWFTYWLLLWLLSLSNVCNQLNTVTQLYWSERLSRENHRILFGFVYLAVGCTKKERHRLFRCVICFCSFSRCLQIRSAGDSRTHRVIWSSKCWSIVNRVCAMLVFPT